MAFNFPDAPTNGQQVTNPATGVVFVWDGARWVPVNVALPPYATLQSPVFTGDPNAPTAPVGDHDQSIASTAFVAAAVAPTYDNVGRNLIHNALFSVAQRGTGTWTANNAYTVDRWRIGLTNDTVQFSQIPLGDPDRAAIGDEAAQYALRNVFTGSATAGSFNLLAQRVEDVTRLSGKTVTLSAWVRYLSGTLQLGANIGQNFGASGSAYVSIGWQWKPITNWTRVSWTFTIPSAAGKTIGAGSFIDVNLGYSIQGMNVQSGTVDVWGVQLEIGSVATPLDYGGTPQQQLAQCQRFYQNNPNLALFAYNAAGGTCTWPVVLPVPMRATPTITPAFGGGTNTGTVSVVNVAANSFCPSIVALAAGSVGAQMSYTASADL